MRRSTPQTQAPVLNLLPIQAGDLYDQLTETASNLAAYAEKAKDGDREELCLILGRFAEIAYAVSGNGSYLHEKGMIEL